MLTRSMRSDSRQKQRAILDKLWSRKVKARDGYRCRICESGSSPEAAHIFSRRYEGTRWVLDNGLTLCSRHHRYFTKRPAAWAGVVEGMLGTERYEGLRLLSMRVSKLDYADVRTALEAE